jgi:hypothetical protein
MSIRVLASSPVQWPEPVRLHELRCNLTATPNYWGCHEPQCGDSTWDHDCPTPPCWIGRSEPLRVTVPS